MSRKKSQPWVIGINSAHLYVAIRLKMSNDNLSYDDVRRETGVALMSIRRLTEGSGLSASAYASLCEWLGVPMDTYVIRRRRVTAQAPEQDEEPRPQAAHQDGGDRPLRLVDREDHRPKGAEDSETES